MYLGCQLHTHPHCLTHIMPCTCMHTTLHTVAHTHTPCTPLQSQGLGPDTPRLPQMDPGTHTQVQQHCMHLTSHSAAPRAQAIAGWGPLGVELPHEKQGTMYLKGHLRDPPSTPLSRALLLCRVHFSCPPAHNATDTSRNGKLISSRARAFN